MLFSCFQLYWQQSPSFNVIRLNRLDYITIRMSINNKRKNVSKNVYHLFKFIFQNLLNLLN